MFRPAQRFAVIGQDAWGQPIIGAGPPTVALRQAGTPSLFNPINVQQALALLQAYTQGHAATPAQLAAASAILQSAPGNGNAGPMPPILAAPAGNAPSPSWRDGQIAPGVETPMEGMVPLPLTPQQAGGVFSATQTQIIFTGQLQKPYRAERFIIQVGRSGTSAATAFVQGQIFVGTDLQQGDITPILLEPLGQPGAFGTRLTLMQAPPGVLIRLITTLTAPLTSTDTIAVAMNFYGRIIH